MAKRTYNSTNKRLFQFTPDGNFYMRVGGNDLCLETNDIDRAIANLEYQDTLTTRFGSAAFNFRVYDLFPKFLKNKKLELRESTYNEYAKLWSGYLEKGIGKLYLADLNQRAWEKYCSQQRTVNAFQNHTSLVMHFQKWCVKKGHALSINILESPSHKRRKRKIIPPQHLRMIFSEANENLALLCSMALFMGMRRSEIIKLDWSRVDFAGRSIILRDEDVKTDDGRHIPMTAVVHDLLMSRMRSQWPISVWVFAHAGSPKEHASTTGLMGSWRRCLLRCGLAERVKTQGRKSKFKIVVEYTWHDLRATYEKYSHRAKDFTDTQREKMVGADIDVQKKIYVSMDAEDLRGMEEVVTKNLPELAQIVSKKSRSGGRRVGKGLLKFNERGLSRGKV